MIIIETKLLYKIAVPFFGCKAVGAEAQLFRGIVLNFPLTVKLLFYIFHLSKVF